MMNNSKVVITEGIIGVGKTTFSKILSKHLDALWMKEPDEENGNPYLKQFYENPKRWAFTMQMHLLNMRYRMHNAAQWTAMTTSNVVIDRSYFGDTAFANLQLETGTMSVDEYNTYCMSYQNMTSNVLLPQVCVFLDIDPEVSQERIKKRMEAQTGRVCEDCIDLNYLEMLRNHQSRVIDALEKQGVKIIKLDWNKNRSFIEIEQVCESIAKQIQELQNITFMDYHRRTI